MGGWAALGAGENVPVRGDHVGSTRGAVTGGLGMDAEAAGGKVDECAVRCRWVAGIKVVAVGDSVESMGVGVVSNADKGADCDGCA